MTKAKQGALLGLTGAASVAGVVATGVWNMDQVSAFLREFGVSVCLIVCLVLLIYRTGLFLAPHIEAIVTGHITFLNATVSTNRLLERQSEKQTEILATVAKDMGEHRSILDQIRDSVRDHHE